MEPWVALLMIVCKQRHQFQLKLLVLFLQTTDYIIIKTTYLEVHGNPAGDTIFPSILTRFRPQLILKKHVSLPYSI